MSIKDFCRRMSNRMKISRRMCVSVAVRMFLASCGATLLFWPAAPASAQAPAGPLPSHAPTDSAPAPAPVQASAKPKLAGTWKQNKDQSDDPRKAMQQAGGNGSGGHGGYGGPGGGGGYPGGGGMGGGRGHGGYGGDRGGYGQGGDSTKDFSQLTIEQTDSMTKVTGASGHVLALYSATDPGNSKSTNESNASAPSADWEDGKLVVVTQSDRGGKTARTYELSPDGKALYVSTRIDNPRFNQPVTFRFVYDPVKAGGSSSY
jgi:hypothetical protein